MLLSSLYNNYYTYYCRIALLSPASFIVYSVYINPQYMHFSTLFWISFLSVLSALIRKFICPSTKYISLFFYWHSAYSWSMRIRHYEAFSTIVTSYYRDNNCTHMSKLLKTSSISLEISPSLVLTASLNWETKSWMISRRISVHQSCLFASMFFIIRWDFSINLNWYIS